MKIRIGMGYDVHALVAGRDLILGGVKIPHETGLLGHSDADVLLHALCDALLGALGLPDIGHQFPNTDERYAGISSLLLLERCFDLVREQEYRVVNLDITLLLQEPKIAPFIPAMKENIAKILAITPQEVSIKATTTEKLGYEGRKEGATAMAVVLLQAA